MTVIRTTASVIALLVAHATAPASAQTLEEMGLRFGLGADLRTDRLDRVVPQLGERVDASSRSYGLRGSVGYDLVRTGPAVLGVEAGLGWSRGAIETNTDAGRYRIDPRLSYDVSARAGFMPAEGLLLYGRVGQRWQQQDIEITPIDGAGSRERRTDRGLLTAVGAEFGLGEGFALQGEYARTDLGGGYRQDQVRLGGVLRF